MLISAMSLNSDKSPIDIASDCEELDLPVSGCDSKLWVRFNGGTYLVKLDLNKAYSEHFGSVFFNMLGVPAQATRLVKYKGSIACLISDIAGDSSIRTFNCIHESSIDSGYIYSAYTFADIIRELQHYSKDRSFATLLFDQFIKMFVVDAIIANRDRHGGNWGYLYNNGVRTICPIFDNGACMFPNLDLSAVSVDNKQDLYQLVIDSPKSQVHLAPNRKKCTFYRLFEEFRHEIDLSWLNLQSVYRAATVSTFDIPEDRKYLWKKVAVLRYLCVVRGVPFNEAIKIYNTLS